MLKVVETIGAVAIVTKLTVGKTLAVSACKQTNM